MAITNHERVGKALEMLRAGLDPYVRRELQAQYGKYWVTKVTENWRESVTWTDDSDEPHLDAAALLKMMWDTWSEVFGRTLGFAERSLVSELREWRNRWAHQEPFSSDDADRALDSVERLLSAVSAPQAEEVRRIKMDLRRLISDEQVRNERRKAGGSLIEASANGALKPWREVVMPHPDVASGVYQQAEFAADLWQVHVKQGSVEYQDSREFFRRTFLTGSLKRLLQGAVERLWGKGGDPVVQLQTNFGGGKTHSMLALYHLFSGTPASDLAGIEELLAEHEVSDLPRNVRRVVLVGNRISPGNPTRKEDGTAVRTLWGELAWQLGGREAYELIRADDEHATSPGDALRTLFQNYGPCLILIDEWVAYARQLHDRSDLPAGSFETQFTFAQALTETVKGAGNCLLVVSLPASDTAGPSDTADDVEVGGIRGREALDRLRNVVGRLESSWRPATAEEGFEIVRRRLFEPLHGPEAFKQRDVTARAFAELYAAHRSEFPSECSQMDYEQRIKAAFPIHPEVFDQLYGGWSTLLKFQRTRGVLRLMAAVIHSLWRDGDRSPLIMPCTIPIDDPQVQAELTRYLSDNWAPILGKDVDGPDSLPVRIDKEQSNLGKYSATRRVARTIYLGSAPTTGASQPGIEDQRVKLGCVIPKESPAVFGDALRRLASSATYLYHDGSRYWYATQPTVTKLAGDRAEAFRRNPDAVHRELRMRLEKNLRQRGDFPRVYLMPSSSADVPDQYEAGLVVLEKDYAKGGDSPAETAVRNILASRGNSPRLYRNTLVFLVPDRVRLEELDKALRRYLAWDSIVSERETLNLDPRQAKQAETQRQEASGRVDACLPEAYRWLLVPEQTDPSAHAAPITLQALPLAAGSNESLAVSALQRLKREELLISKLAASRLRMELDRVPLWRGNHVTLHQLIKDFASHLYLPRLLRPDVLVQAASEGVGLLTWQSDGFAYAESYDEQAGRYRGLCAGQMITLTADSPGMLVRPEVAAPQIQAEQFPSAVETPSPVSPSSIAERSSSGYTTSDVGSVPGVTPVNNRPRRFHGSVKLDARRAGLQASQIAEEVIAHLAGQVGAEVTVTLEISATLPEGASDQLVRTVTENSRALRFTSHGFEMEED